MTYMTGFKAAAILLAGTSIGSAATLHVHDSAGVLGTVEAETGDVNIIGNLGVTLTDIGFDPMGNLFGVSFTGFYSVDAQTAQTTLIGNHGISGANALVFDTDGTLYAGGNSTSDLFTINPTTGAGSSLGTTGFGSGGDLAFVGDDLYLASTRGTLVSIDVANPVASNEIGSFGVGSVFGIATDETDTLFGVGGTSIFTVDQTTGAAGDVVSFGGQGLGTAFGQSFFAEAVADPTPTTPTPTPTVPTPTTPTPTVPTPTTPPTVVPVPASILFMLTGVFGLTLLRRKA